MIDKGLAYQTGLFDILNVMKWGEGRYGERILDQESNLILKGVMHSDRDVEAKKRLIGEHVFAELGTHADFGGRSNVAYQAYAEGGQSSPEDLTKLLNGLEAKLKKSKDDAARLRKEAESIHKSETISETQRAEKIKLLKIAELKENELLKIEKEKENVAKSIKYVTDQFNRANVDTPIKNWLLNLPDTDKVSEKILDAKKSIAGLTNREKQLSNITSDKFDTYRIGNPKNNNYGIRPKSDSGIKSSGFSNGAFPESIEFVASAKKTETVSTSRTPVIPTIKESQQSGAVIIPNTSIQDRRAARRLDKSSTLSGSDEVKSNPSNTPQVFSDSMQVGTSYNKDEISTSDLIAAKRMYNDWARKKKLSTLPTYGVTKDKSGNVTGAKFDQLDETVLKSFEAFNKDPNNYRKISVSGIDIKDPVSGDTQQIVKSIGLDKFLPEIQPLRKIGGYDKKGNAVYVDPSVDVNTITDPKTGKLTILNNIDPKTGKDLGGVNDDNMSAFASAWNKSGESASTLESPFPVSNQTDQESRDDRFTRQSNIRQGLNALTGVTGALLASNPIPKWVPTPEYEKMRNEVYSQKDQGFSPEEQAAVNQGLVNNYAQGVGTIRSVVGNGGNQGAVLASMNSLSQNLDNSYLKAAQQDVALRRQNFGRYQNMVMTDMGIDQQMFQQDYANAMETKQAGLAMAQDASQKMWQEQMYRESYGPDTLYNELQTAQLEREKRYTELMKLQAENFKQSLIVPTTPATATPGSIPLSTTTNNPLQSRFSNILPR
ncbi:hypothetical protein [Dyadobacter sp. CY312]|uniref:hypothetical protein n=1 Tax=Dyadobacter sp. CY312 TaxID=2907303 RepID=UPI001F442511|nr:hypothetical protein [Dyadobacter sp. CY312]MCE7039234.1 hypothetical protein [Dyadobacter sp. CY312]